MNTPWCHSGVNWALICSNHVRRVDICRHPVTFHLLHFITSLRTYKLEMIDWIRNLVDRYRAYRVRKYLRSFRKIFGNETIRIVAEDSGYRVLSLELHDGAYWLAVHANSHDSLLSTSVSNQSIFYRSISFVGPCNNQASISTL